VQEFMSRFPQESVVVGSPHISHHDLATTEVRDMGRYVMIAAAVVAAIAALVLIVWSLFVRP
jgi:hypothetical protein